MANIRFCLRCDTKTRALRCPSCGFATRTKEERAAWRVLCALAELDDERQYLRQGELYEKCGDGASRIGFGAILRGLAKEGRIEMRRAWDGPRFFREPGALIEFYLGKEANP